MHLIIGEIRGPDTYYDVQTGAPRTGYWFWAELRDGDKCRINFCVSESSYKSMGRRFSNVDEAIRERVSRYLTGRLEQGWNPDDNVQVVLSERDLDQL
jgi:hypothetical protein